MPLPQNPLDSLAEELGEWIDQISTQIAQSVVGGYTAPGAASLSERQKLDYYTRQFFNPDGSPNDQGRAQEMLRLGPEHFAEVWTEVVHAHPDLAPPPDVGYSAGYRGPDGLPGSDIAPDGLPEQGAQVLAPDGLPYEGAPVAPQFAGGGA